MGKGVKALCRKTTVVRKTSQEAEISRPTKSSWRFFRISLLEEEHFHHICQLIHAECPPGLQLTFEHYMFLTINLEFL